MSFRDAEATDATLRGIAAVLRGALEEPAYHWNPDQVYDNMDGDPLIGALPEAGKPASRLELLRYLNPHRGDPSALADEVVSFCRHNPRQGPSGAVASTASLGHVQSVRSLVNGVADPAGTLGLRDAEALVRDLVNDVSDASAKLAKQKSALDGKSLVRREYQMWCYPAADSRHPFAEIGSSRADAINALGLGWYAHDLPGEELLRWAHTLPTSASAHRPTAWDAGADKGNVYWRPGGKTYRLDRDDYGPSEVVHAPVEGQDLVAPIQPLS